MENFRIRFSNVTASASNSPKEEKEKVVIHQASSLYAFEKKTISKINFSGAMVKPGRKIDFSEIKGINSRMPCQKYCRGVDHDAIWCCCRGSAKAMSICEDRKTDCERKCVEAKAECCFDGY
ncbi:hypothetical protein Tco_1027217 [Tanacetum coccineum]